VIAGLAREAIAWLARVEEEPSPQNVRRFGEALDRLATYFCPGALTPRREAQFAGYRDALTRVAAATKAGQPVKSGDVLVLGELAAWRVAA
jgi:hypothetical protein